MHDAFAAIEPPVKITFGLPMFAVTIPPHVVVNKLFFATTTPFGKLSMSGAVRFATVVLGLLKVIVSNEILQAAIEEGLKALLSVGAVSAAESTVRFAMAEVVLLP